MAPVWVKTALATSKVSHFGFSFESLDYAKCMNTNVNSGSQGGGEWWTAFDSREDWPQLQLLMGLNIRDWQYDLSSLLNVYMPGQRTSPLILQQPRDSMQNQLYNEGSQEWQDSKTQLWTQKPTSHLSLGTSSTGMSSEHAACCLVKTMVIFRIHTSWLFWI